jgi:hypothetical protein
MEATIHNDNSSSSMLQLLSREAAVAALLLFVAATVAVTCWANYRLSAGSLQRTARIVIVTIEVVVLLTCRFGWFLLQLAAAQTYNVVSDILTFPTFLQSRLFVRSSQDRGGGTTSSGVNEAGDDEVDSYRLLQLGGFYSLRFSSSSEDENANSERNEANLFEYRDIPPGPLQALHLLRRPPNLYLPSDFPESTTSGVEDTPWKQFQEEARLPGLWLDIKTLAYVLLGISPSVRLLFQIVMYLLLDSAGVDDTSDPVSAKERWLGRITGVGIELLMEFLLSRYWFHAFCRSTSRVCTRWNPYLAECGGGSEEGGYSVQFVCRSVVGENGVDCCNCWNYFPLMVTGQTCYLQFRQGQRR